MAPKRFLVRMGRVRAQLQVQFGSFEFFLYYFFFRANFCFIIAVVLVFKIWDVFILSGFLNGLFAFLYWHVWFFLLVPSEFRQGWYLDAGLKLAQFFDGTRHIAFCKRVLT